MQNAQLNEAQEELPRIRGQRQRPGGATLCPRPGAVARRTNPTPEARGSGREDEPQVQGAVAAWAPEGLEELFHIQGWEGRQ